jgi:hypothetical protein
MLSCHLRAATQKSDFLLISPLQQTLTQHACTATTHAPRSEQVSTCHEESACMQ